MNIHITNRMTGKMIGLRSINSSPQSNPFCQKMAKSNAICKHCYSIRLEKFYGAINNSKGIVKSWVDNGDLLSKRLLKDSEIPLLKSLRWVRFHAHGELLNRIHLMNFIRIAEANPKITFALWTKRLDITKGNLKQLHNLFYVYSVPKLNRLHQKLPTGFHKVFSVLTKDYINEGNLGHLVNCQKKCAKCGLCYTKNEVTHIYEIKK